MLHLVYQFNFTDDEIEAINAKDSEAMEVFFMHTAATHFENPTPALEAGRYELVATIDADSLEHAFRLSNDPHPATQRELKERLEVYGRMHSLSVGDIVVTGAGVGFFCQSYGWKELSHEAVMLLAAHRLNK